MSADDELESITLASAEEDQGKACGDFFIELGADERAIKFQPKHLSTEVVGCLKQRFAEATPTAERPKSLGQANRSSLILEFLISKRFLVN